MISIADFRVMPFEKKCDVITFTCDYLVTRIVGECKVYLYHAEDFYVEVFYSAKNSKILMINAFDKTIGLEPYLDAIGLADLGA